MRFDRPSHDAIKNLRLNSVNAIPHAAYQRISKYFVRVDWLNGVFANCTSVAQRHDHVAQMSCSDLRNRAKPLATPLRK